MFHVPLSPFATYNISVPEFSHFSCVFPQKNIDDTHITKDTKNTVESGRRVVPDHAPRGDENVNGALLRRIRTCHAFLLAFCAISTILNECSCRLPAPIFGVGAVYLRFLFETDTRVEQLARANRSRVRETAIRGENRYSHCVM